MNPYLEYVINDYWSDIGTINQYRMSSYDVLSGKIKADLPFKETKVGRISPEAVISRDVIFGGKTIIGGQP